MGVKQNLITDSLSVWIGIKALIDSQSENQDFTRKNFEDMLFEVGEMQILNAISNSSFLWQRANAYFACKQREKIRDILVNNEE